MNRSILDKLLWGDGGFSLIEVLVALVVLSIGLLGLAGLQAKSLKENHQAYLRTQATMDAYQIIDCMRANPSNKANYVIAVGTTPATPSTGASIAEQDLSAWKTSLGDLPGPGDGSVVLAGTTVTVVVQWDESGSQQSIQVQTEL